MRWKRAAMGLVAVLAGAAALAAQGTADDYARAAGLAKAYRDGVEAMPWPVHWTSDGGAVWWERAQQFVRVDARTGERRTAATLAELGLADADRALPPQPRTARSSRDGAPATITLVNGLDEELRIQWIDTAGAAHDYGELAPGGQLAQSTFVGHVFAFVRRDGAYAGVFAAAPGGIARADAESQRVAQRRRGRDGVGRAKATVFARDDNLFVRGDGGADVALTTDGSAADAYRGDVHVAPDGAHVLAFQEEPAQRHDLVLVESSPTDQVQPKVHTLQYLKPGDRIARPRPRLFDLATKARIDVDEAPFADAWSLDRVHWRSDSKEVHLLYNRRGHQQLAVRGIDAASGAVRTIVEEQSATFVDYSQKTFLHWLDDTGELLWMSERDGNNHLWLIDVASGGARQLTHGDWRVRTVDHVDAEQREVWFAAMGLRAGQDPYHRHLARVSLDGGEPTVLTESDGDHEWQFAPDGQTFATRWSRVDQPPVVELRRCRDGALVAELGRDDATRLFAQGFRAPERFVAKGRDGATDIHGILIRPSNFDPARRYPVLEAIYAGPHDFFVPKRFGLMLRQRALAELGFVVVQIDGMGTNWRSKAFHDVCWRNLADAGFPDRIAWLRAAAAVHPELDLDRVGIFGGSAGGQSALAALLFHGDFYCAAAADCGCHDNRMDKIWWNEAWMGWPVGDWYAANSNVTHAANLRGKLLLTVGELDRNVDPSSTLQVVAALQRAGKEFEFVLVPGAGHGCGERPDLARRRMDFFVRALLGVEPRR